LFCFLSFVFWHKDTVFDLKVITLHLFFNKNMHFDTINDYLLSFLSAKLKDFGEIYVQ